jgi:HK97 family phage major capsid protein
MNRILELTQAKDAAAIAARAILDKIKTDGRTGPTVDEQASLDVHFSAAEAAVASIKNEERMTALAVEATSAHGGGGSNNGGRIEIVEDWLEKPFGPEVYKNDNAKTIHAKRMMGFGEQLMAIRYGAYNPQNIDQRLMEINKRGNPAGASEQVPADGGFLVYPDFSQEIELIAHETGLVYMRGKKLPITLATNGIKVPGIDEQSRADGSRWGGIRMYWQNEADALVGSKPKFRLIELALKKLTGLFYATDEVIADAGLLGSTVTQGFGEELGFKMDDAAINGDGLGKPLGVMNSNCLVTIAKETGQPAKTVVFENVRKMYYRLHARSRKNAVWFVNQDVEQALMGMSQPIGTGGSSVVAGVAPSGPSIYKPVGADGNPNPFALLFGLPVIPIEQCQTVGTPGDIILADMSQWIWIDKGAMQQAVSMHVQFQTDQMTFRWIYRVDGSPIWHTPLQPFAGSASQSPFLALAQR